MCTSILPLWYLLCMSVEGSHGGNAVVISTCNLRFSVATTLRLSLGTHVTVPYGVLTTSWPGVPVAVALTCAIYFVYTQYALTCTFTFERAAHHSHLRVLTSVGSLG